MYAAKFVKSKQNKDVFIDGNHFEYIFKDKTKQNKKQKQPHNFLDMGRARYVAIGVLLQLKLLVKTIRCSKYRVPLFSEGRGGNSPVKVKAMKTRLNTNEFVDLVFHVHCAKISTPPFAF